jgi:hypothetical protein
MSQGNKNSDGTYLDPRDEEFNSAPIEEYHIIK